jgi:hypothetical protein
VVRRDEVASILGRRTHPVLEDEDSPQSLRRLSLETVLSRRVGWVIRRHTMSTSVSMMPTILARMNSHFGVGSKEVQTEDLSDSDGS